MFKKYILLMCLLIGSTACAKNTSVAKGNSINDFFASKEYDGGPEEIKCIDESQGGFEALTSCAEHEIKKIRENIKKKLISLNKPTKVLDRAFNKITIQCRKETINNLKEDNERSEREIEINEAPTIKLFTASCIKVDLYQFGRNLK
ncbi:MAG: hypothetical protein N4Q30_00010 [Neisseriaceae bacterium]|nr:hypothetical protein [Neisseriaceae bacterium]